MKNNVDQMIIDLAIMIRIQIVFSDVDNAIEAFYTIHFQITPVRHWSCAFLSPKGRHQNE